MTFVSIDDGDGSCAPESRLERRGAGLYQCQPGAEWRVGGALHGGYAIALAMSAVELELSDPATSLQQLSLQFLRAFVGDEVRVEVRVERSGRRVSNATVRMHSGGRLAGVGVASVGVRSSSSDVMFAAPPRVAPYEPADNGEDAAMPEFQRRAWIQPRATDGSAGVGSTDVAWVAPRGDTLIDHRWIAVVADLLVPPASRAWTEWRGFQTLDLTYHARCPLPRHDLPPGSPVLVAVTNRAASGGFVDEDVDVWSPAGDLLAQSRQMRLVMESVPTAGPRPAPGR